MSAESSSTKVHGTGAPLPPKPGALTYHAGLDGLRGLAMLAIIVYHSGSSLAPGAFLSVSTFFTLSGFLIGRVILAEHARSGTISLRRFWSRRVRRLMPAALMAIALIVVASVWLSDATQWLRLRGDALASEAYVANWHFIAAGDSYGANFASASPFTHFWTLAIEEQFYVILPLLMVLGMVVARLRRRGMAIAVLALVVTSLAWTNWLIADRATIDRLYFGTDIRAPELLVGVLLALWWTGRDSELGPRARSVLGWAGPLALLAMLALWAKADLNDLVFYRGGLTLYSLLTLVVIAAAMQPNGPLVAVLSWRPLVWVGLVSYAAYLVHYPVLLWLRQWTGFSTPERLAIAVPVTFIVAALSGRFVERPIRSGKLVNPGRGIAFWPTALIATVALIVAVTGIASPHSGTDLESAARWQRYLKLTEVQNASDAPRISFYGDSTAVMTGRGMSNVSLDHPDEFVASPGWAELGCGLNNRGKRMFMGEATVPPAICLDWLAGWGKAAADHPADVAVVQLGPWDVLDQQLKTGGPYLTIGQDPELDRALTEDLQRGVDELLERNGIVVLLLPPDVDFGRINGRSPEDLAPESDPSRMADFRKILESVAASDERVHLVDLNSWVEERNDGAELRPDGVHFTEDSADTVAAWLGPELVQVFTRSTGQTQTQVGR